MVISFRRFFKAVDQLNEPQMILANKSFTNAVLPGKDNRGTI